MQDRVITRYADYLPAAQAPRAYVIKDMAADVQYAVLFHLHETTPTGVNTPCVHDVLSGMSPIRMQVTCWRYVTEKQDTSMRLFGQFWLILRFGRQVPLWQPHRHPGNTPVLQQPHITYI